MNLSLVKTNYEKIADDYAAKRNQTNNLPYLELFSTLVPKGKTVLDVGCGAGNPVDTFLVNKGFAVNGIDNSKRMISLAKQSVPEALYEVKDMLQLQEGEYCVNGIVSLYALFHTPREMHQQLLKTFASFMPQGGAMLLTMGAFAWEGSEQNFHGEKMYWSQYGAVENTELVKNAGFTIVKNVIDTSGGEKHQFILAELKK